MTSSGDQPVDSADVPVDKVLELRRKIAERTSRAIPPSSSSSPSSTSTSTIPATAISPRVPQAETTPSNNVVVTSGAPIPPPPPPKAPPPPPPVAKGERFVMLNDYLFVNSIYLASTRIVGAKKSTSEANKPTSTASPMDELKKRLGSRAEQMDQYSTTSTAPVAAPSPSAPPPVVAPIIKPSTISSFLLLTTQTLTLI